MNKYKHYKNIVIKWFSTKPILKIDRYLKRFKKFNFLVLLVFYYFINDQYCNDYYDFAFIALVIFVLSRNKRY